LKNSPERIKSLDTLRLSKFWNPFYFRVYNFFK